MPRTNANGIELNFDQAGCGETVVLVHGSWSDRNNWLPVAPTLAESFRVISYDRRGSGLSERGVAGSRLSHEDDLAALIEHLGGNATVVGTSFGGSISIGLASRRPELVSKLVVHEPPLISIAAEDPECRAGLRAVSATIGEVIALVEQGDPESAARRFVEEVALGPGAWDLLPAMMRETMVDSAASFVAEQQDPAWAHVDRVGLEGISCPVLVTDGDSSPPWFKPITNRLADAIPNATTHTYVGAGHAPHLTHPDEYLSVVGGFVSHHTEMATVVA